MRSLNLEFVPGVESLRASVNDCCLLAHGKDGLQQQRLRDCCSSGSRSTQAAVAATRKAKPTVYGEHGQRLGRSALESTSRHAGLYALFIEQRLRVELQKGWPFPRPHERPEGGIIEIPLPVLRRRYEEPNVPLENLVGSRVIRK